MGRGLILLYHHAEPVDRRRVMLTLQVVTADLHFLAGKVIVGQIELQHRRARIIAVGIKLDHLAHALQRLEGQPLIASDLVDLVVIGQRQQILGIGRVFVCRIVVQKALGGHARFLIVPALVIGESLHDQGALGPFRIGIKPLHFRKILDGFLGLAVILKLEFAALIDFLGGEVFKRRFLVAAKAARAGGKRTGKQNRTYPARSGITACHLRSPRPIRLIRNDARPGFLWLVLTQLFGGRKMRSAPWHRHGGRFRPAPEDRLQPRPLPAISGRPGHRTQ